MAKKLVDVLVGAEVVSKVSQKGNPYSQLILKFMRPDGGIYSLSKFLNDDESFILTALQSE